MKRQAKYPVGAKWVAENSNGKLTIWLDRIQGDMEIWRWSYSCSDGSSSGSWRNGDWGVSYKACYDVCAYKLWIKDEKLPRFKRVKDIEQNESVAES